MNVYEVYMEGYRDNGGGCGASYVGYGRGNNFAEAARDACVKKFGEKETQTFFDVRGGRPSFWGCRMFDNYADAAKKFWIIFQKSFQKTLDKQTKVCYNISTKNKRGRKQ